MNGCRDGNGIDPAVSEEVTSGCRSRHSRMLPLTGRQLCWIQVTNSNNLRRIRIGEITDEIRSPISVADNGYPYVTTQALHLISRASNAQRIHQLDASVAKTNGLLHRSYRSQGPGCGKRCSAIIRIGRLQTERF